MDDDKRFRTPQCIEAWNAYLDVLRAELVECDCSLGSAVQDEGTIECTDYCGAARSPFLEMHGRCAGIRERPRPKCKAAVTTFYQTYSHRKMRYCNCDYYTLPPHVEAIPDE